MDRAAARSQNLRPWWRRAATAGLDGRSVDVSAGRQTIGTLLCPGLGTAIGRLSPRLCARQMRAAWDRVEGGRAFLPTSLSEAGRDDEWLKGR